LKNKFFYILTVSVFLFAACDQASEEALNAGFKSDKEYKLHLENVKIKRDKDFKETILYVSNINAFDLDSEYLMAAAKLSKEQRKYISSGGEKFSLIIASEKLLSVQGEIESVNESQETAKNEAIQCIIDLEEPDRSSSLYETLKGLYDLQVSICKLNMFGSESVSNIFLNTHTAARQLVNTEQVFNSRNEVESYFQTLLEDLVDEQEKLK
jgi:hypothetical protein